MTLLTTITLFRTGILPINAIPNGLQGQPVRNWNPCPTIHNALRFNEAILPALVREYGSYMPSLPTNEVTGNWTI